MKKITTNKSSLVILIIPLSLLTFHYSLLKLRTGLAKAAFIAWKLMVINVMTIASNADNTNTDGPMVIR